MPTFSGEPIRYCQFINAFESIIENKEPDSRQCLYYLSQYTRDMAIDLVVAVYIFMTLEMHSNVQKCC